MTHEQIYKIIVAIATCVVTIASICLMSACSFTRTVTTTGESYTRGDTAVHISTRTVESYHATDNRNRSF